MWKIPLVGVCRELFTRAETKKLWQIVNNREEWASAVKGATVLRGP
jgi:hypothetical protein